MPKPPKQPFVFDKAPVAHEISDELLDGYFGGFGVSMSMLTERTVTIRPRFTRNAIQGALPHVVEAFEKQGFEVVFDDVYLEYRLVRR